MQRFADIFLRGARFVRDNPQIIYTLFLVVAIPLAFFYTSERFLRIARENQDGLERSRVALLTDVFVEFAGERMNDPAYLDARIKSIADQNPTIVHFDVLVASGTEKYVYASLESEQEGKPFVFLPENEHTMHLFSLVRAYPENPLTDTYYSQGVRIMRTVRAIPNTDGTQVADRYIMIDFSMAQGDQLARDNIRDAYIVLFVVILLIIILLARQARIIDYVGLYQKLKEVDQMKDDFVSMAAHELRSPLTIIRGYTELIGEREKLTDKGKTELANIDHAATQLNSLIADILDVAKLQEGRMSFSYRTIDVDPELATIVESFDRPAKDKGLSLTYERKPLPLIEVDVDRFRQVMINFIGNAIKYTPSGSVRVITATEGERLAIRISDTGMGISAEDQKRLFQKFFRVKSEETKLITGTGLGLWITAEIVRTMRGTISVESIKGKGTDFIVSFPIKR